MSSPNEQAVLVYLDGQILPQDVYELEDQLIEVIESQSLGEFDGNEFGPDSVTLYMYAPEAEKLFSGIESVLRSYPLRQNARVIIRQGEPGSQQREVLLSGK